MTAIIAWHILAALQDLTYINTRDIRRRHNENFLVM